MTLQFQRMRIRHKMRRKQLLMLISNIFRNQEIMQAILTIV